VKNGDSTYTRDSQRGSIYNPKTLNRYAYCSNNPIKYIDPDGHDIFDPSWGQGADRRYSLYWAYIRSQLLQWKFFGQIATTYYNWANEHKSLAAFFQFVAPNGVIGTGAVLGFAKNGSIIGFLMGLLLTTMYITADQFYAEYWNNQEFVDAWNEMEGYLDQMDQLHLNMIRIHIRCDGYDKRYSPKRNI
jgi:hypothetical protein